MYWVGLSRFKSITSQNPPQSHPIHSNTHVISITEQALKEEEKRTIQRKACSVSSQSMWIDGIEWV
jgi:hypothetical protein